MKTKAPRFFRRAGGIFLTAAMILSAYPAWPAKAETANAVYDLTISDTDQQTVKGWGVFPSWNRADWNRNFIDKTGAQQALFQDLGASMFRIMIPAVAGDGDGNLIDAKMQEIYDLVHVAENKGMHDYMISVWSPPVDMKTIPTVNGWTGTEHVRLRPDKEDAYTSYLVDAIQWLASKGASVPKALSFQNEPLSQIISEWCYWGGDNGAQYQRVAKLLRSKLDAAGFNDVQILGPEGASYHENELLLGQDFSALTQDAELNNAIGGLTSHSYFSKGYDNTGVYQDYLDALNHFPDKDRWQTEYSTLISGISEMDMAINVSQRLASDMAFVENNYWFWWLGWASGRHPTDEGEVLLDGDGYTVTKSKAFYVLSKIFNNVPVGSKVRRIDADPASGLTTVDSVWMDGVAFVNGSNTTALIVNPTDQAKTVNLKGLTGAAANVYQATSDLALGQDMKLTASRNIQGGTASSIELPAKSVSVVVTSDTDTAPPHITFDQSGSSSTPDASYAVRDPQFTVSGHLDEAGTLLINGEPVTVGNDLSFSKALTLQPGMNTITAAATDTLGNAGDPVQLQIRYDPSYLGLSLDQSGVVYVQQGNYNVTGRTNGNAAVTIKHEFNGATVSENTYNVGTPTPHQNGDLIRQIFNDSYVQTGVLPAGLTVNAQAVRDNDTAFPPEEGTYSLRLKLNNPSGFSRINFDFVNTASQGVTENYSAVRDTAALQFWVYPKTKQDNFFAVLESDNGGTAVEARVPLTNYIAAADYGNKWVKVTIPLTDFDAAAHFDPATNQTLALPIAWDKIKGIGFSNDSAVYYDPHVDDIKLVYANLPSEPSEPQSTEFNAELNLLVGDNTITASAVNELNQQAAPSVVHVVYDPDPPVLTVPSSGTTAGTSYVLNGSVNEPATVKVNGIAVTLKSDYSFTAVVPVVKGENAISVVAEDLAHNITEAIVNVTSDPVDDGSLAPGVTAGNLTEAAPTIDGNLSESGWIINNRVEKMITGASDNNVSFGTMWDASYLYVGVKVLDADLRNDSDPDKTYQDDSVEIYIDGDNSRSSTYGSDDHQITLGWHDSQISMVGAMTGVQFAQQDIDGGFTVEMAIPWSGIGIETPHIGSVIGFDVAYNDDDGHNAGNRESQLMWRGNGDNWLSTAAFGSLYLNDGNNVTVALEPSGALTTDGQLDEPYWALRSTVTKTITGSPNNSVRFGVLGDTQNLYVGIEVLDDELKNDSDQAYQDDSVEVYIDADNNRGAAYDAYDHQITLGWHDSQISMIGTLPNVQYAQQDISGGYTVEMAIPWASLNITPARDITLGFDVGINDDDGNNGGNRDSQLMWNGTGNNWQDTSNFGHLLVHNLSLPLPDNTAPEPEGLKVFSDNAADLSKLYEKTAHIVNATGHPENFNNDADRITHNIDNPADPEYVVYQSPSGDIYSFDIATGLYSNTPQFAFYGSADNVTYTKITAKSSLIGGANGYSVFSNTASNLPAGTRYLKIVFPGMANWMEQLMDVSFKYFDEPSGPPEGTVTAEFTDDGADLTKLYDKSGHIINVQGGQLDKYAGDNDRIIHSNDDIMDPEYVVYKSPDADIYSFDFNVTVWVGLPSTVGFEVYGSEDGASFAKLPAASVMLSNSSGYDTLSLKTDNLAGGIRYLKIVFPYGDPACDNWTSTINQVKFIYGVTVANLNEKDTGDEDS